MNSLDTRKEYREGLLSVVGCNIWWGIMPIYWQWLIPIDSWVIIFYRIFLVALVCFIAAMKVHGTEEIKEVLRDRKLVLRLIAAGIMITINWSIYIWAVNSSHVIQTSIGYYIEPLVVCLFGVFIFKEKINKYKAVALIMGLIGVVAVIIYFREMPTIALGVAITFSIYTAMKKGLKMPPILSLFFETVFLAPFALIVIIYIEAKGIGGMGAGGLKYFLLMFCGLFTAFPLVLFANAANKISMFVLGLSEYISPTLALLISIFYFKEDFAPIQLITFGIIWVGLIFFTMGEYKEFRNDGIQRT